MNKLDQELIDALHDCMVTYAPEFCDDDKVVDAWERFKDGGGYLGRLADLKEQLIERQRKSLPPPPPNTFEYQIIEENIYRIIVKDSNGNMLSAVERFDDRDNRTALISLFSFIDVEQLSFDDKELDRLLFL